MHEQFSLFRGKELLKDFKLNPALCSGEPAGKFVQEARQTAIDIN
jgi:hypothetical protein